VYSRHRGGKTREDLKPSKKPADIYFSPIWEFSCGDCRRGATGQVAVAVGEGCIAAIEAEKYLQENL
jgi:hypothetical protein